MKLFTKEIDNKLFKQYPMGADLENQVVVAKIFNPYGRGVWYLLNSDPNDPDYIWAIVDLIDVEMGSVSRSELEELRVPPFRLPLERDLYFAPISAKSLYEGLQKGKQYAEGGTTSTEILISKDGDAWLFPQNPDSKDYGIKLEDGGETKKMDRVKFVQDMFIRIVHYDNLLQPRDDESQHRLREKMMEFIFADPEDYVFTPLDLVYRAYISGLYDLNDLNEETMDNARREAQDVASYYKGSGEGFGTSDFTASLNNFLRDEGIKTAFVNGRLERLDENGEVSPRDSRYAKGGETKSKFLHDVRKLHSDIKEIKLKDGSIVTHEEMMNAHKMAKGGMMADGGRVYKNFGKHNIQDYLHLKDGTKVFVKEGYYMYPSTDGVGAQGIYYIVKFPNGEEKNVSVDDIVFSINAPQNYSGFGSTMAKGGKLKEFIDWNEIIGLKLNGWEAVDNNGISILWENDNSPYSFYATPGWENEEKLPIQIVGADGDFGIAMYSQNQDAPYELKEYLKEVKKLIKILSYKKSLTTTDFKNDFSKVINNSNSFAKGGKTPPVVRTQFEEEEFEYADGGEIKSLWRITNNDAELLKKGNSRSINTYLNKEQKKNWRGEKSIYDDGAGLEGWPEDATKEQVLNHIRNTHRSTDQEYANGGKTTVVEEFGSMSFRNQYDDYEMVVIAKELEKDGGYIHIFRYLVSAKDINEAKEIATALWEQGMSNSDLHIVKVMSDEAYRLNYMGKYDDGGELKEDFLEDLHEMHQDIDTITLQDGTTITGKELHEAHKMAHGGEVKAGDILEATTGVKVKVVEYDPKFGGRVRVERMDEYATGKPSHWMFLTKFKMPKEEKKVDEPKKPARNKEALKKKLNEFKKGGEIKKKVTFNDKVDAISKNLEGKKVKSKYKGKYGATYDRKEAREAAKNIVGKIRAKYGK